MQRSSTSLQVVSLGRGCQPAHQIRRITGVESAYPLDWLITTDDGVRELVTTGMSALFERDRLAVRADGHVVDEPTQTVFFHEFPIGGDIEAGFAAHYGRFVALRQRWVDLMHSDAQVIFVRQHGWNHDSRACAASLRDALTTAGPRLRFTLLYLTPEIANASEWPQGHWDEPGIVHRALRQPDPYDWHGDDAAWDSALLPLLRRPSLLSRVRQRLR